MSTSKTLNKKGDKLTVTFYVTKEAAAGAKKIFLICEHNGWEPVALKQQKSGIFSGSISVPVGEQEGYKYKFKYILDNGEEKFENDWKADKYVANPFNAEDSFFTVEPTEKKPVAKKKK